MNDRYRRALYISYRVIQNKFKAQRALLPLNFVLISGVSKDVKNRKKGQLQRLIFMTESKKLKKLYTRSNKTCFLWGGGFPVCLGVFVPLQNISIMQMLPCDIWLQMMTFAPQSSTFRVRILLSATFTVTRDIRL